MQKRKLGGRPIRVGWAQKNTNLFVGDLDNSVSDEMLRSAFRAFGPIVTEDTFVKARPLFFSALGAQKPLVVVLTTT